MELKPYQICRSNDGWLPVVISSSSSEHKYRVYVNPWGHTMENICECKGYIYTGHCKHQDLAADRVCGWSELDCEDQQSKDQKANRQCPRCGGPTKIEVEIDG